MAYSFILSTYGLILLAYFVHENRSKVQWLVALGLAGFFVSQGLIPYRTQVWVGACPPNLSELHTECATSNTY